jgi:hypothetical protein
MVIPNPIRAILALCRVTLALVTRRPLLVIPEETDRRMRACDACPFYHAETDQCGKCSCFVGIKVQLTTEKCPIGKW